MLDLARELITLGHDVRLYSALSDARVEAFGLARHNHRSMLPFVAPLMVWQRHMSQFLPELQDNILSRILDWTVASMLEPCDIFICMSGIFVEAIRTAKRRYGASVWLERGSRHILSQVEILAPISGARGPGQIVIRRELEGYQLADRIVVPSSHVADSFKFDPNAAKLFVNAYGTDLEMFPYRERVRPERRVQLVFAGTWSLRKGCDLLIQAIRLCSNVQLLHVGPINDLSFPEGDDRFKHVDAVPQASLSDYYAVSDVLVQPSREEGLSIVQLQALATGLPIICTDRTGGADLGHTRLLRDRITIVPHDSIEHLVTAIEHISCRILKGPRFTPLTQDDLETLSWTAYGTRYSNELRKRSWK